MGKRLSCLALAAWLAAGSAWAKDQPADPLAHLAAEISAVLDPGSHPRLLIFEDEHGATSVRTLTVGDEYHAGWRLAAITPSSVTLRKGAEERVVRITGQTSVTASAPAPVRLQATLAMSNASVGAAGGRPRSQPMAAAIAKGDLARIAELKGTAADAVEGYFANRGPMALATLDFSTAKLVRGPDGHVAALVTSKDGVVQFVGEGSRFDGFAPPGGIALLPTADQALR